MNADEVRTALDALRQHDLPTHGGRTLAYVYDSGLARIFSLPVSRNTQFMFIRTRFNSSGGQCRSQRTRGTTPNIAPPSNLNSVSGITSNR